jgi:hypothetical protein
MVYIGTSLCNLDTRGDTPQIASKEGCQKRDTSG